MAVRLSPSPWLTASCSDPNTSDPPVWRRDQRGPDRQTARLAPCLSCQNRQAANKNAKDYYSFWPLCPSLHASVCKALFLSDCCWFFCDLSVTPPPPQTVDMKASGCETANGVLLTSIGEIHYTQLLFHPVLFYSIFLTLRDRSGGWNVWRWGWEEREQRRETTLRSGQTVNPRDHRTLEQGSVIHGLWVTSLRGDGPIPVRRYC